MLTPDPTTLTGIALATALFVASLAPPDVRLTEEDDGTPVYWGEESCREWEPWCSWDAVAHLIEHYDMDIRCQATWEVSALCIPLDYTRLYEEAPSCPGIPAAAGRLALRLRAQGQGDTNAQHSLQ